MLSPLFHNQFVTVVPPQMREGSAWFQGTADAVCQNLNLIEEHHPELVVVFGADHVYRMDVAQMIDFHVQQQADVTVACLPVPLGRGSNFGIVSADSDCRIHRFDEKPARPLAIPGDPDSAYASMGNYVFSAGVLVQELREAHRRGDTDFGSHLLPRMLKQRRLFAYNFADNAIPGLKAHEEPAYWRDVGTIDAYFEAHRDVLGLHPRFDLFDPQWPIHSSQYPGPVALVARGDIENSLLGAASVINGARLRNTIVRRETVVEDGAEIEDCIIMDYVHIGRGARLRRAIVDRHNAIEAGTRIGFDAQEDHQRYHVSSSGITVVPRGRTPYFPRAPRGGGHAYGE